MYQRSSLNALQAGAAIAVSDGSFKDSQGTAAFFIEGASPLPLDASYR
jgi:hypothetical protein